MKKIVMFTGAAVVASLLSLTAAHAASKNSARVLQYVPADTPYVLASTKPPPAKFADKFEPTVDELLKSYQKMLRHIMAEQLVKMAQDGDNVEDASAVRGVAEELINLMSLEGLRGAGMGRDAAVAIYGNGILPVIRMEVTDEGLFDAAIERIEAQAGESLQVGKAGGESYKFAAFEKFRLVLATIDEQAIFTIVPLAYDESQVSAALGIQKPANSLRKSKTLRKLGKEYGFTEVFSGYIDNQRIARMFTGQGSDTDNELFAAFGESPPELSETCSAEIMQMAGIAPRVVMGYSKLTTAVVESHVIVELREDIAQGLTSVSAKVPGLGTDPGGFMSIGFGLNPLELRGFYESRIEAMENEPYECDKFAELQAGVVKGRAALDQPLPPVVYSFRGFVANIADITGFDMASKTPPESVDGSVLIAMENAEALLQMAAMFDPQIAALKLLPDGKPVKLELAQLAEIATDAYAALTSNAVSVAMGNGAESVAADVLVADSTDPAPFMSMSIDAKRYYALIGDAFTNAPVDTQNSEGEMPDAVREAMADIMTLSGDLYERMTVDVHFTDKGIDIGARATLSDD